MTGAPAIDGFDVVVVGAGIVGLAHAWAAARRGLRVALVEQHRRCVGASVRNFGFVTVTGQRAGQTWARARRSREWWLEAARGAGIAVEHQGLWLLARRPAAWAVLERFAATDMGAQCTLHSARSAGEHAPYLNVHGAAGALHSPHELRVDSRDAVPRLAAWLAHQHGVRFFWSEAVLAVEPARVRTSGRVLHAERVVLCPGAELHGVAAPWLRHHRLTLTRLQMLRVHAHDLPPLDAAVMADLSLVRYAGFAALPEAAALRTELDDEAPQSLAAGIHLIVVRNADGSLVVGDSHHDDDAPAPFASAAVERLMLAHLREAVLCSRAEVLERWIGHYPVGHTEDCLIDAPDDALRVVVVTSGTGASTAFAVADEVFEDWGCVPRRAPSPLERALQPKETWA